MQVVFQPPLGHTTTLKVPPSPSHLTPDSSVTFKATVGSRDLEVLSEGVRVEVWTDLPMPERPRGEWGAVEFTNCKSVLPSQSHDAGADGNAFNLSVRVALQEHVGSRFQFTYRLVHPSGYIQWLGTQDGNGMIQVEAGIPGIHLSQQWQVHEDGKYHLPALPHDAIVRVEDLEDWTVWVWNKSSFPVQFDRSAATDARALVFLPLLSLPETRKPLIMVAQGSWTFTLTPKGMVSLSSAAGQGQAMLGLLEYSHDLLEAAASICNGSIVAHDSTSVVIASRLSDAVLPIHVLLLPLGGVDSLSRPVPSLHAMFTPSTPEGLLLFAPQPRRITLLNAVSPQDDSTLEIGSTGAEAIVSSLHFVRENDKVWQFALLAPHMDAGARIETPLPNQPLPTPPPSPPILVPSDLDNAPRESQRAATFVPVQPQEAPRSLVPDRPRRSQHRYKPSLTVARNLPARLLRAYLHAIFNLVFWFWNVFFRAFATRLVGEGIPRRVTSFFMLALSMTSVKPRSPAGRAGRPQPREERRLPEAPEATRNPSNAVETTSVGRASASAVHHDVPAPQPQRPSSSAATQPVSSSAKSTLVFSAILKEGHAPPILVLRSPGHTPKVRAVCNGRTLQVPSILSIDGEERLLLEFADLPGEGRLEVFFDL